MNVLNEILRALGRIEGELVEIRKLSERVTKLAAGVVGSENSFDNGIRRGRIEPCSLAVPSSTIKRTRRRNDSNCAILELLLKRFSGKAFNAGKFSERNSGDNRASVPALSTFTVRNAA